MSALVFLDPRDRARPAAARIGQQAAELAGAAANGLLIVPTFVVGKEPFSSYRATGELDGRVVSAVVAFAAEAGAVELTIRPATDQGLAGLPGAQRTTVDRDRIRYLVERVYRGWSDSHAKWYREFYHLTDEQSYPPVIVQAPKSSPLLRLCTRNPQTGSLTSAEDYSYNVNNRVPVFKDQYTAFLRKVEAARNKPTQVDFQEEGAELYIVNLGAQVMSAPATLTFVSEQHAAGIFDDIQVLSMLEPRMLGAATQVPYGFTSADNLITQGIAASSGIAAGRVVWPGSSAREAVAQASILAVTYSHPDDLPLLISCVGAFSTSEGRTGHLAVASRGMGKPAVVGAEDIELDHQRHEIRLRGKEVPSNFAHVNGDTGYIRFSTQSMGPRMRMEVSAPMPFIDWVDNLAQSLVARGEFATLTVPLQTHIAALRNMAAKIRAGHD